MTERVESPTSATIADTSEQPATRGILRMLALMGPAFVAGAWQFGPGNLTTAVQAGSGYLYTLIWVIVVSTILMIFLTDMSVRLGIRSPISLIASIKDELGTWVGVLAGVGVFLITLCFSVGNAVGSGLGISLLVGGSPVMWSVIATIAVGALFLPVSYTHLDVYKRPSPESAASMVREVPAPSTPGGSAWEGPGESALARPTCS